jgi:hypothetical protein
MSKRKKRRNHAADEDAASEPALAKEAVSKVTASAPKPDVNVPHRYGLVLLFTTGSLWVGWFLFLVYVALTRS